MIVIQIAIVKLQIIINYQILAQAQNSQRMFYYIPSTQETNYYNYPLCFVYDIQASLTQENYHYRPHSQQISSTGHSQPVHTPTVISNEAKVSLCENENLKGFQVQTESNQLQKEKILASMVSLGKNSLKSKKDVGRLSFRIDWKNSNRNIVPNIINQMMSFLLKKCKSQKLIQKLFLHHIHQQEWTLKKFYNYLKLIKDSTCHYLNESVLQLFFQLHQPKCQLYKELEQQFYMKLCRISILTFLRNDAIVIPLTSNRMNSDKRNMHLIAREAILNKFLKLAQS